ncbi:MAG TPA: DUF4926 domain-containing protein [Chloroflexia bacterium]|nr:DUF4926 domain-containing protein [Chloroflexia bacterium]
MMRYAKFSDYQQVKLKRNRASVSERPITNLDVARAISTSDRGVIVDVHDVEGPGYEVEFSDDDGNTVDLLTLAEDEIEPY